MIELQVSHQILSRYHLNLLRVLITTLSLWIVYVRVYALCICVYMRVARRFQIINKRYSTYSRLIMLFRELYKHE